MIGSMAVTGWLTVFLLFVVQLLSCTQAGLTNAGRYNAVVTQFEYCDDKGTDEIKYSTRFYKTPTGETVYRSNWTWPYDLDDHLSGRLEVSKWGSNGWGRNFYNFDAKNFCETFKKELPKFYHSFFFKSMNASLTCPILAGTYYVNDWNPDLTDLLPFSFLPYGKYRADSLFFKDGVLIGCWRYIADVTQKID